MVLPVESRLCQASSEPLFQSRGRATFQFERLHRIIADLRRSSEFGWVVDILDHFTLSPERFINIIDVLSIGSKLETAADILEKRGVRRQLSSDGWTTLDEEFSFWVPIFPKSVSWCFSFNRKIRAFRLSTHVEKHNGGPVDLRIECCLGARNLEEDGVRVLAKRAGKGAFEPVYESGSRASRNRCLALTAAKELEHSARDA